MTDNLTYEYDDLDERYYSGITIAYPIANFTGLTSAQSGTSITYYNTTSSNWLQKQQPEQWYDWTITPNTYILTGNTSHTSQNIVVKFLTTGNYVIDLRSYNCMGFTDKIKNITIT